ncbi:unnamed protein product [Closterium sp. NIES-65]|nr:unnamed protein product [Closterium sp. NIES-65]
MATPSVLAFDAEGRAIDFEVWVDDLQLFLQCDRADGLSLFDLTSGASPAPAADADPTVRSQWATRDAAARLAVRRHLPTTERAHFSQYKSAQTLGVLLPPFCPLSPLPLRPTSLVLSRSVRRLPLAGDAALARARGARARVELAGAVEVAVEAAEGVGVAVGVVAGVEVSVAAVEAEAAEAAAVLAEAAVVAEVEEAVVEEVSVVGVALRSGAALVVVSASSSSSSKQRSRDIPPPQQLLMRVTVTGVSLPDPGIGTAALGAGEAAALGASASAPSGAGESALSGTTSASASLTFTLDSGASRSFFRDRTTLTPLGRPVAVSLADPSGGPVLSHFSTVLPVSGCPLWHLVAASGQVFAAASRSGPESAPCSCRLLSHETLLWHHRLGHPSLPRLRGMASRFLVSGLPRSLPPLPPGPGPSCVPCVEGRLRAAPHSSQFPPTEAPLQTLHMDVWGPARVLGQESSPLAFCEPSAVREASARPLRFLDSPQQNGIAERRIGMVMDVARTSMMHAAAPHFLWPFAVRYAEHQINLHPRVSMRRPSLALQWTGKVGDASGFRVWGSWAFVRDLSADKLSPRAAPCVFLGFPPDAPGWQFYHPSSRRVHVLPGRHTQSSRSRLLVTLVLLRVLSLGVLTLGVLREWVLSLGVLSLGVPRLGVLSLGVLRLGMLRLGAAEPGGAASGAAEPGGTESGAAEPGGAEPAAAGPAGVASGGIGPGGSPGVLLELVLLRLLRVLVPPVSEVLALGVLELLGLRVRLESELLRVLALRLLLSVPSGGPAAGAAGAAGGTGAGGAVGAGAATGGAGAVPAVSGVAARPRPYFSRSQLPPASPLPAPSPYTGPPAGLAERREPASPPASPVRAARASGRGSRQRPPPVPGTHRMSLPPSTAPLRAPLPSPPESSLSALADPESDSLRAASPTVTCLLATVVTDPSIESTAASSLVAELVDFAVRCRLDYAASLVAESTSVCPPSVGGECALGTDVLEDRQDEFQCLAAASPHLVSVLLTPEGDPDALDIPTPRSYAEAIEGPYSFSVAGSYGCRDGFLEVQRHLR